MLRPAPELSLRLTDSPTSTFAARRALRRILGEAASTPFGESAVLALTELINNALAYNDDGCWVVVWYSPALGLRAEVEDSGTDLPRLPPVPPPSQVRGRGLNIVDTVADRWGSHHSRRGKTVWFELDPAVD